MKVEMSLQPESRAKGEAMNTVVMDYENIRDVVGSWPYDLRVRLMRDLVETLMQQSERQGTKRNALKRAIGLLNTGSPPPNDEEVERILEESRMEKYG